MWNEMVVCMKEKYRGMVKDTNKSLYQISHETGIPYTILNELKNEKKDINNIASETVYKLCLYFGCQMEDIMNPFAILKNSKGVYFGMKYKWNSFDDGIELHIYDNDADITLTRVNPVIPRFYNEYHNIAEMLIEKYIKQKHIEEELL